MIQTQKLTFNETTYEFNYFLGTHKATGETFDCYGVYVNGALKTDYVLEEGTIESGVGGRKVVEKIFILFWKSFSTYITIKNFSLGEVAKVIDYIHEREGENLLDGLVENPNNFDEAFSN